MGLCEWGVKFCFGNDPHSIACLDRDTSPKTGMMPNTLEKHKLIHSVQPLIELFGKELYLLVEKN